MLAGLPIQPALFKRQPPVRFETSADDVAALLAYLNIQRADIFGFSNGASVALQVAIRSITASTLILAGDQDIPTPQHAVELTRTIPHARLLIVPGGHGDYLGEAIAAPKESRYPELVAGLIEEFLDAP
jgi:pimeloyl-ACP methyl ester carboxylesterase